jgi:DNA-3-methyladenine glycosylase II
MHDQSIEYLKRVDPVLATVIERVGPCRLEPRREGTHFDALVRSILYQQLSGKAASTIHQRMHALYGGRPPTPAELLATPDESLRSAGLSRQKLTYLKDLAAKVEARLLPLEADEIDHLPDDEIITRLIQVKGIGRWTVHMFLIFRLGRANVLPELDLGVQNAIKRVYRLRKQPGPKDVRRIGAKWSPHASIASWYLWRSLEGGAARVQKAKPKTRDAGKVKRVPSATKRRRAGTKLGRGATKKRRVRQRRRS